LLLVLLAMGALSACGDDDYNADAAQAVPRDLSGTAVVDMSAASTD
jgi:hypothetical protein